MGSGLKQNQIQSVTAVELNLLNPCHCLAFYFDMSNISLCFIVIIARLNLITEWDWQSPKTLLFIYIMFPVHSIIYSTYFFGTHGAAPVS